MIAEIGSSLLTAGLVSLVIFTAFKIKETRLIIAAGAAIFVGIILMS
jgi:hypothetical protein